MNGGTITATASEYSYTANGSGSTTWGAAISVAQHTTVLPTAVTLNGGTLAGVEKVYVKEVNAGMPGVTVQATETFTQTATIPTGYEWAETATSGVYELVEAIALTTDALELYPNCSNSVEVVHAPAGATFKWTFAGSVANASGANNAVGCMPYGKSVGNGTATVEVSVNDTVVETLVCNVTVKDVAAVIDETEYTTAEFDTAVAAAIADDKVLGVYTSDGTVTLTGGQTLKVRAADNRGVGGVAVFTDLAQYIVAESTDAGVTTYVCTAVEVNDAIAGVAGLDTATAAVNGPAPITKIEVSEFATDAQNCLGWKITFTPVLGTGVDLAGWVRATIANEKIAVKHAASVADLVSGQNVTESAVKGAEHLEYVDYDKEAGTVTVVVPVPDTTANNVAQFFRLVIK